MRRHDIRTGGIYYGTADYKTDINWRNASDGYGNRSNLNGSRNALRRMPIFRNGKLRRSLHGTRNGR